MKRAFLILFIFFTAMPVHAKSYICRSDGSVDAFESGEEIQVTRPLRQNEIEEVPVNPVIQPKIKPVTKKVKSSEKKRSDLVPLTQEEIEQR